MIRSLLLGAVAAFQVENIILDQQLGERSFNDRYVHVFYIDNINRLFLSVKMALVGKKIRVTLLLKIKFASFINKQYFMLFREPLAIACDPKDSKVLNRVIIFECLASPSTIGRLSGPKLLSTIF